MKARFALTVAIALSFGCNLQPAPTGVKAKPIATKPRSSLSPAATGRPIPLSEPPRVVDTGTRAVELIGKVKFISNGGANIISDNGASVISNNGGGIISDNGASLVSKVKYAVAQAGGTSAVPVHEVSAAVAEALLADAQIEVLDAAGHLLVDAEKKPITATTDNQGNYKLKANLPNENLILRVRLFQGGQLFAFTTKDQRTDTLDIDTASSLGAAFVMDRYVKKQQAVLDKLPGSEAGRLRTDMEAARVHLTAAPSYRPEELVSTADQLRGQAPQLADTLERIEALLLAGQAKLGEGLQATQVALALPTAVAADAAGNLYIAESTAGRIRKVAKDGTISVYAGPGGPPGRDSGLGLVTELILGPDGSLYTVLSIVNQIVRIPPEGPMVTLAGNGIRARGNAGAKATTSPLHDPSHLAFGPDGLLYFNEGSIFSDTEVPGRILMLDPQGLLQEVPMPEAWRSDVRAMTVNRDGKIWFQALSNATTLYHQQPGGSWKKLSSMPGVAGRDVIIQRMVPGPDNTVYISVLEDHKIYKASADGTLTVIAGTGTPGHTEGGAARQAAINRPAGMLVASDGSLYFAEQGNGLVRRITPDGTLQTIAGTRSLTQVGDALTVSINQPGGIALDGQGRILVAEAASHTIKRLDGNQLTVIAGTAAGFSGDGGPAAAAAFRSPGGIAWHDGELYVLDGANDRLRKIDRNGIVSTLAGGTNTDDFAARVPADKAELAQPAHLIIGPDGLPYWTETLLDNSLVLRLKDGFVEVVAGTPNARAADDLQGSQGDGGPATAAKLASPTGMAFDKDGNLYVADSGNFRIRKIDKQGVITTVAGMLSKDFLPLAITGKVEVPDGSAATQTPLWAPAALQFDAAGNLYFAEIGTANSSALGSTNGSSTFGVDFSIFPAQLIPKTYPRIRKLTPDGKVFNVTGPGTSLLADTSGDNMLIFPLGMVLDPQGRLVIADAGLNQLKVLPKGSF